MLSLILTSFLVVIYVYLNLLRAVLFCATSHLTQMAGYHPNSRSEASSNSPFLPHTHAKHLAAGRSTLILFIDLDNVGVRSSQIAHDALPPSQSPFKVSWCTSWASWQHLQSTIFGCRKHCHQRLCLFSSYNWTHMHLRVNIQKTSSRKKGERGSSKKEKAGGFEEVRAPQ